MILPMVMIDLILAITCVVMAMKWHDPKISNRQVLVMNTIGGLLPGFNVILLGIWIWSSRYKE